MKKNMERFRNNKIFKFIIGGIMGVSIYSIFISGIVFIVMLSAKIFGESAGYLISALFVIFLVSGIITLGMSSK